MFNLRVHFLVLPVLVVLLFQCCAISQSRPEVVCITKTGAKYHRCDCRYVANSSYEITLDEALKRSYGPCSVCKPASSGKKTEVSTPANKPTEQGKSDKPQKRTESAATQCTALTQTGRRCKRSVASGSSKCWQHREK